MPLNYFAALSINNTTVSYALDHKSIKQKAQKVGVGWGGQPHFQNHSS